MPSIPDRSSSSRGTRGSRTVNPPRVGEKSVQRPELFAADANGIEELVGLGTIDIIVVAAHFKHPDFVGCNKDVVALQIAAAGAARNVKPLITAAGNLRLLLDLAGNVLVQETIDLPADGIIHFAEKAAVGVNPADHVICAVAHIRILPGVVDAVALGSSMKDAGNADGESAVIRRKGREVDGYLDLIDVVPAGGVAIGHDDGTKCIAFPPEQFDDAAPSGQMGRPYPDEEGMSPDDAVDRRRLDLVAAIEEFLHIGFGGLHQLFQGVQ